MLGKDVICNKLWDELYVNDEGNVFSCCHNGPYLLGNIYESEFKTIINSPLIKLARKDALNNKLSCFKNCNLTPSKVAYNIDKNDNLIAKNEFNVLKILFGEKCNIDCIMCWQDSKNKRTIDFEKLKSSINVKWFKHVLIQGGEPFASKEALEYADYVIKQGVEVSFLTNALLITSEWAEKVAKYSDFIHISINAATKETHEYINRGSNWEKLLENVKMIRTFKDKYNSNLLIKGHMTIVKENLKEIPLFLLNYHKLGFDIGRFGYDSNIVEYLENNQKMKKELKKLILKALEETDKKNLDLSRLEILKLI